MATVTRANFVAAGTQLATSATEYVTAGTNDKVTIDKVLVFNTGAGTEVIAGYVQSSGATPGAADQVFSASVPTGESQTIADAANITLGKGEALFLSTTTGTTVNLHASGRRIAD